MIRKLLYISLFLIISSHICSAQEDTVVVKTNYVSFNPYSGNIDVRWQPFTQEPVNFYRIMYYTKNTGGISNKWDPISNDLPGSVLTFSFNPGLLAEANPLAEPVYVGVFAYDFDDNIISYVNRPPDVPYDQTIYLEASFDTCKAEINFDWNHYNFIQWPQPGTFQYRLYASTDNGSSFNHVATVEATENSLTWTDFEVNQDYTFFISAIAINTADSANSNSVNIDTRMARLPEYMEADYAKYNNGLVDLSFSIDPNSQLNNYKLLRSKKSEIQYDTIDEIVSSEKELILQDNPGYYDGPFYYKLIAVNYCDQNIRESDNRSTSILLKQQGEVLAPELFWSTYYNWTSGVAYYSVNRKFGNEEYMEISNQADTLFTDSELASLVEQDYPAQVCYQISTQGPNPINLSESNPICIDLPVNIRFEYNAFSPGSGNGNDTFGPTIDFIPTEYSFKILDRSGRKVFESNDPENTLWDGSIEGSRAPQGAYMAVVQYRIGSGRKQTITSGVAVVY